MRNFGFVGEDEVSYLGTNGKMNEAAAAMGLTSLESMDEFIAVNRRNYECYARHFADVPGISVVAHGGTATAATISTSCSRSTTAARGIARDLLQALLRAENVLARRYFYPGCHRMEPYRTLYPHVGERLPHTNAVAARVLSLPTGTAVNPADVGRVCELIRFAVAHGGDIAARAGPPLTWWTSPSSSSPTSTNGSSPRRFRASSHSEHVGGWELLISDDGSTDGTRSIIETFAAQHPDRDPRVLLRSQSEFERGDPARAARRTGSLRGVPRRR